MNSCRKCIIYLVLFFILKINNANSKKFGEIFKYNYVRKEIESRDVRKVSEKIFPFDNFQQNSPEANRSCDEDVKHFRKALGKGELWSYKMIDASSKIPSGILEGNFIDIGMYDECVGVEKLINLENYTIKGRHCMYVINVAVSENVTLPFTLSACVSHRCGETDVVSYLNRTKFWNRPQINFNNATLSVKVTGATCSPVDQEVWTTWFMLSVLALSGLIIFLIICTWIDILINKHDEPDVKLYSILREFSFLKTVGKIFGSSVKKSGNIAVLNGLRFFNMAWVILGHQFVMTVVSPNVNSKDLLEWIKSWNFLYIVTAPFAVDSFFAISGFLTTYLFLKQMKINESFNILAYYVHRYLRLTPTVFALIVFNNFFMQNMGSGAMWNTIVPGLANGCQNRWWYVVSYSQNFFQNGFSCLPHLWYLAAEMQLFLVSPIILLPLHNKPKLGLGIVAGLVLASLVIHAAIVGTNKYHMISLTHIEDLKEIQRGFEDVYCMPYTRAAPWLVGIFFGYAVVNKVNFLNKLLKKTGLWLSLGSFTFCILGTRYFMRENYEYNVFLETSFSAISKVIWGFGVSWIIYASTNDHRGKLLSFLSRSLFAPFSRLSYCTYLVHMLVLIMITARTRTSTYFSDYYIWMNFLSNFVVSIVAAFFFSVLFESPMITLERLFKGKALKKTDA